MRIKIIRACCTLNNVLSEYSYVLVPVRPVSYAAMTYEEFQRQLGKAGISVKEFAGLLGMNRNSVTNCSLRGEVPSHLAVIVALMAEMAEHQIDFKKALSRLEIAPKKPRGAGGKGRFGGSPQAPLTLSLE